MKVNFSNVPSAHHVLIKRVIKSFIDKYKINPQSQVNITFVSKTQIKTLNNEYRHINEPTDVLSFPIWSSLAEIPKNGEVTLGDIFICPKMTNIDNNLSYLVEHSLKHLIGKHH